MTRATKKQRAGDQSMDATLSDTIELFRDGSDVITARKKLTDSGAIRYYDTKRWEPAQFGELVTYARMTLEQLKNDLPRLPLLPARFWNEVIRIPPTAVAA